MPRPPAIRAALCTLACIFLGNTDLTSSVLELRNISKSFAMTAALSDMSFSVMPGEIHAIVGENGAGKSTLIKIMTGVHQPDHGTILADGKPATA